MKKICFIVWFLFLFTLTVLAADAEYRFTHNDHDTLIIGEVIGKTDRLEVHVFDYVVGEQDLNQEHPKKQLRPEEVWIEYADETPFKEGDYLIASLNQKGDHFVVAWGIYKVDQPDKSTLSIEAYTPEVSERLTKFVNHDGRDTAFDISDHTASKTHIQEGGDIYQKESAGVSRMALVAIGLFLFLLLFAGYKLVKK